MTDTVMQTALEDDADGVATLEEAEATQALFDNAGFMSLEVTARSEIAEDIYLFELRAADRAPLPPFEAGAHVLVRTPAGVSRRYSLCNMPGERDRYQIAVKLDGGSRGGSASMVHDVRVGARLKVARPENYFALTGDASSYLLIAGGIGITPLRAMIAELEARNAPYHLLYCTRTPASTAFLDELSIERRIGHVTVHHDFGERDKSVALAPFLATRDGDTHLYCCGPRALMQAVREAAAHWPASAVHFEDFGTRAHSHTTGDDHAPEDKPFVVRLTRRGVCITVQPHETILEALRDHDIDTPSSCEAGTCGSCRTKLLAGDADHRDFVLDEDEYGSAIMICVSRAKSDELVLDL